MSMTYIDVTPRTTSKHVCPKCGHAGVCEASPHLFFAEDKLALRCIPCRHIWAVDRLGPLFGDSAELDS